MLTVYVVLAYAALVVLLGNVSLGLIQWKDLEPALKWFVCFLCWNLGIEVLAKLDMAFKLLGGNNLPLLHLYTLGEFVLLFLFYTHLIEKPVWLRRLQYPILLAISMLIVLNSAFVQDLYGFNTYAKTGVQLLLIGAAVLFFFNLAAQEEPEAPSLPSLRLINSAILIYYSSSLVIFMFGNFLLTAHSNEFYLWVINASLNILFHILIFIALWNLKFRRDRYS